MINDFIEQFTYLGIFAVLFLGGLGAPIPEELPILAAGALAHEGYMRWWVALPVCLAGVLSGDSVLYWVGYHWGERILEWSIVRRVLTPTREHVLMDAFLTAGIARVPFWKFILVDAAAALLGVPTGFALAYFFTDQVHEILHDVRRVERWLTLLALVALAAWIGVLAWRKSRAVEQEADDGVL